MGLIWPLEAWIVAALIAGWVGGQGSAAAALISALIFFLLAALRALVEHRTGAVAFAAADRLVAAERARVLARESARAGGGPASAVVGALMWPLLTPLPGVLPGTESIRPSLPGTQCEAWHALLRTPADWVPITRAVWLCALYIGIPLIAGYLVFLRRDVAGE